MKFKKYVDVAIMLIVGMILGAVIAGPAHAAPTEKAHKERSIESDGYNNVYVFDDPANNVVCYVTRNGISCLPRRSL
jgi:hypothetical protein